MRLCFGTFATVLSLCKSKGVDTYHLVGTITKTVDENCKYGDSDKQSSVNRLLKCTANLSDGKRKAGSGAEREGGESLSQVSVLAPNADKKVISSKFKKNVFKLIDREKKECIVLAILDIIEKDETLDNENKENFKEVIGKSKSDLINQDKIILSDFLSRVFLYTVIMGDNTCGEEFVGSINEEYINSLQNDKNIRIFGLEREDNINVKQMRTIFEQKIIEFNIAEFINKDPSIYLKFELQLDAREFCRTIYKKIILEYTHHKEEVLYINIKNFVLALIKYTLLFETRMESRGFHEDGFIIIPSYRVKSLDKFKKRTIEYRIKLDYIYSDICNGKSLLKEDLNLS